MRKLLTILFLLIATIAFSQQPMKYVKGKWENMTSIEYLAITVGQGILHKHIPDTNSNNYLFNNIFGNSQKPPPTRRTISPQGSWGAFYFGVDFVWNPGDTFVLKKSEWTTAMGLGFDGFRSIAGSRIVVINEGSDHTDIGAILFRNCWNIKCTGTGGTDSCGFHSNNAFSACDIDGRSKSIEFEWWDIENAGYAIRAKQDPACADSLNYPNWHMDSIDLEHCRIRYINQDGIYIGNTAPTTGRPIFCTGVGTISPIPMRLSNAKCVYMDIDSVGRTAIQASGVDSGNSEIAFCHIRRCGYEVNNTQGSGIIIGGMGKNIYVHGNVVDSVFQFPFLVTGCGLNRVEDNIATAAGSIPMFHRFSNILTNTDTTYWPIRAGGPGVDVTFEITGTRTGGTTAGTWYIVGSPDGSIFTQIGTIKTLVNGATFADTIHIQPGSNVQYWRVVVNQVGTQVNVWKAHIINPGYPYGIAVNYLTTLPVGDSLTIFLRNNILPNPNPFFSAAGIVTGNAGGPFYTHSGSIICGNLYQNTLPVDIHNDANVNYSTDCSGTNAPPVVNAGADTSIILPTSSLTVHGIATSLTSTIVSYLWVQLSGPNTADIVSPTSATTNIISLIAGVYIFKFTATDANSMSASATITVTVVPPGNIPPTADAGPDKNITLPTTSVTLVGSGSDPDGTVVGYQWTKVSGSFATIQSPTNATTAITDLVVGVYVFKLTVTDNLGAIGSDNVTVTVNAQPGKNKYYRMIITDHTKVIGTDQIDFPIVISTTDTLLRSVSHGGKVSSESGFDIQFSTDTLNSNRLFWDIEKYDPTTGQLIVWVKIPLLHHSINDTIYMNYGDASITGVSTDPTSTWNSGFSGVFHMASNTDATINKNNAVITGLTPSGGQIDGAQTSTAGNQYLDLGQSLPVNQAAITITAWIYITDYLQFWGIFGKTLANQPNPFDFYIFQGTGIPFFWRGDGIGDNSHVDGTSPIPTGRWVFIGVTDSVDKVVHFQDGDPNGSGNLTNPDVSNPAGNSYIGTRADFVTQCPSVIDEVRISNVPRTANWIKTEYNSTFAPSLFYSIGPQVTTINGLDFFRFRLHGRLHILDSH